eukprot:tig00000076_g2443.t1
MADEEPKTEQPQQEEKPKPESHPLENQWCLWYDARVGGAMGRRVPGEKENYESNLKALGRFGTVEGFWRLINNTPRPSMIEMNANLHLFKDGIKPMWEDSANKKGGKLVITLKGDAKDLLDRYWEDLIMALVGETLDPADELTGAVASRRKAGDRIALWFRNYNDSAMRKLLTDKMKELLRLPERLDLEVASHDQSLKTGASYSHLKKATESF